jgi:alkylhydroperoxidase/carboxymuconolactone decarboxylase family protein YurZ
MVEVNAPVLEAVLKMNEGVAESSELDAESYMLVRIAALAATGAPPASYLLNLGAASELGLSVEQVQGVLIAIAPVIGSARVASAGSSIAQALGLATALAEDSEMEEGR